MMPALTRERHLLGHVALVTGAAGDLGAAVARRLAADGATVAVNDRELSAGLEQLATEIHGTAAPADIRDRAAVAAMADAVQQRLGVIDVLVANAAYMTMAALVEHDLEDWWAVVDSNLTGTFTCIQAVLEGMRGRGAGRIIVVTSEWGVIGWPNATAYSASKGGLVALTKSLGRELARDGIVVNAIAPSAIDTGQLEVDARAAGVSRVEISGRYAGRVPLARLATPAEIAAVVAYLADFCLGALVGQILNPNGGTTRARA